MREIVQHIDPDGVITDLEVEWGTSGRFMPPVTHDEQEIPGQPGSRWHDVQHGPRSFVLPLWIADAGAAALRALLRDLVGKMDPSRGESRIRVTAPGGDQREITCRYESGLELLERLGETSGPTVQRAPLVLRAHDPYWYAVSDVVVPFGPQQAGSFFPLPPIRLSSSEVFADVTIDAIGDAPQAWPVWTIQGPGANVVLRNFTTGKSLRLKIALGGESVTVDTRPGRKLITRHDGTNLWPAVVMPSALWSLKRGLNAIRIEMASAVATTSEVQLAYRPCYLTA